MSRGLSMVPVAIAVILVVVGLVEHFAMRVTMVPHLAIILGVVAVILLAASIPGFRSKAR